MTLPSTLLIRTSKHRTGKQGAPRAVQYRNGVLDSRSDLEAMIEGYGLAFVLEAARTIQRRRDHEQRQQPENFKHWSL